MGDFGFENDGFITMVLRKGRFFDNLNLDFLCGKCPDLKPIFIEFGQNSRISLENGYFPGAHDVFYNRFGFFVTKKLFRVEIQPENSPQF